MGRIARLENILAVNLDRVAGAHMLRHPSFRVITRVHQHGGIDGDAVVERQQRRCDQTEPRYRCQPTVGMKGQPCSRDADIDAGEHRVRHQEAMIRAPCGNIEAKCE